MENTETTHEEDRQAVEQIAAGREKIEQELGRVIIGQKAAVEEILITLFRRGQLPHHRRARPGQDADGARHCRDF